MDDGAMVTTPYASRFRSKESVDQYTRLYEAGNRDHHVWTLQQEVLAGIVDEAIQGRGAPRLLDFACGTGRVLSFLEDRFDRADGVDLSPEMLKVCGDNVRRARLLCGDILQRELSLLDGYDVVTAFRFFLNAPDSIRVSVLVRLRELVAARGGIVVFNNHGNRTSLRHLALRFGRGAGDLRNELSDAEVQSMLAAAGLRMVERVGVGILPDAAYRTRARRLVSAVDSFQTRHRLAGAGAIDQLYVATPV